MIEVLGIAISIAGVMFAFETPRKFIAAKIQPLRHPFKKYSLQNGAELGMSLIKAVERGDIASVKAILVSGADINFARSFDGGTALHVAIENGEAAIATYLKSAGARTDIADHFGVTASELDVREFDRTKRSQLKKSTKRLSEPHAQKANCQELKIRSPLVGTFLHSNRHTCKTEIHPCPYGTGYYHIYHLEHNPNLRPLVEVGDHVTKGQVVCGIFVGFAGVIDIESNYEGIVQEIVLDNQSEVEYNQILFVLVPKEPQPNNTTKEKESCYARL